MSTGHELEPVSEDPRLAPPGPVPGPSQLRAQQKAGGAPPADGGAK